MRLRLATALATSAILLIPACGSEESEPASEETSEAAPTEEPSPEAEPNYELGDKGEFNSDDGGEFNVTIEDFKKDIPNDGDVESDQRVDALLIRACNVSFDDDQAGSDLGTIIDPFNFSLVDDDDGEYDILDLTPSPAPQPQLDTFDVVGKGDCKKGWLAFDVPAKVKLQTATYSVGDGETLATWNL